MGTLLQITEIPLQNKETHVLRCIESIWWNFAPNSLYGIGEVITWPKWPKNVCLFSSTPPPHLAYVKSKWTKSLDKKCEFEYLCICIFVFALLTHGNIIFDILEQSSFQKYTTWWVFLALCNMLYLCICVFAYLCICIWVGKVTARPIWPKKCQSTFFNFLIWATKTKICVENSFPYNAFRFDVMP